MGKTGNAVRVLWAFVLAAVLAVGLAACGSQAQSGAAGQAQSGELYGSPWVSSIFAGNLPAQVPKATDDLYLHYGYGYIADHQDAPGRASVMADASGELKQFVTSVIKGEGTAGEDIAQLRIFYNQAADLETLEAAGADELRPYLKAIADTTTLAELEAVLLSPDFPFSPWIDVSVNAPDMKSTMCVQVLPHMLFTDNATGADVYKEGDESASAAHATMRAEKTVKAQEGLRLVSLAEDAGQAVQKAEAYFTLEKAYGSKCLPAAEGLDADYGTYAQQLKLYTVGDLAASCPRFPMAETIAKLGMDASHGVIVTYPEWLTAFNNVWTEENFETLRGMTEVKVLMECAPFIAPSYFSGARQQLGVSEPTADVNAWAACDKTSTFSQLLAKTYADGALGEKTADELVTLTNELIDSFIDLVGKTTWLNAQSRENIIDKIDNIALNILYPDGGYFDYSGLALTPSDKGGTLLGNYLALKDFNMRQEAALIGQPARASAPWLQYTPTRQNCAYDPMSNSISIYPGYITSAMYAEGMSREEVLGGIGLTLAHEISHAFDYNGSQFNAYGQAAPVFTDDDVHEFTAKCDKLASRYDSIEIGPGKNVDGSSTVVEAMADLNGLQAVAARASAESLNLQELFGQFAFKWAAVYSPAYVDTMRSDPHPPANVRVNVSAQMRGEFHDAFGVSEGDAMYLAPEQRVVVWGE